MKAAAMLLGLAVLAAGGLYAAGLRLPHHPTVYPVSTGARALAEVRALAGPPARFVDPRTGVARSGTQAVCRRRPYGWACVVSLAGVHVTVREAR